MTERTDEKNRIELPMQTAQQFLGKLGPYLIGWWGFVFTVGGTIGGLVLAREWWWISVLIVLANAGGCFVFAYKAYRSEAQAKADHAAHLAKLVDEHSSEMKQLQLIKQEAEYRREEAERRVNEVPLDIVTKLQSIVQAVSYSDLGRALSACAEIIERHKHFLAAASKPLSLQTLTRIGDRLFALVKAPVDALALLRVDDPFVLVKRADGVELEVVSLLVHQPPDTKKEVAYFAIVPPIPPELETMADLLAKGEVSRIQRYSIRPAYSIAKYTNVELSAVPQAIALLVQEALSRLRGGSP